MPALHNLEEANAALLPYVQRVNTLLGTDTALSRIAPLMRAAGNPHQKLRIIHVAGTSGKTSTAYFIAALLRAGGNEVGLTVSPHVDSVTERVQLNGLPLSEVEFCNYLGSFLDIVETLDEQPSYFELLYSLSFWVFADKAVDYAVVETGMGGLWDPTNIATQPDKICVITDIGFDHMHILGHTIQEIAAQKAGIIHAGNVTLLYHQSAEIDAVMTARANEVGATLRWTTEPEERTRWSSGFATRMPAFQQRNWLLAHAVYEYVQQRDDLPLLNQQQPEATQSIQVPGRMDGRQVGGKQIIMDGAHNGQKMAMFVSSFQQLYPGRRVPALVALKETKEPIDVVPLLAQISDQVIITKFDTTQDLPAKSIDPQELAEVFRAGGITDVRIEPDQQRAYAALLEITDDLAVVTGSFYLLSQLRQRELLG